MNLIKNGIIGHNEVTLGVMTIIWLKKAVSFDPLCEKYWLWKSPLWLTNCLTFTNKEQTYFWLPMGQKPITPRSNKPKYYAKKRWIFNFQLVFQKLNLVGGDYWSFATVIIEIRFWIKVFILNGCKKSPTKTNKIIFIIE